MIRKFGQREETRPSRAEVTARRGKTSKDRMDAGIAKAKAKAKRAKAKAKMPTGLVRGAIEATIDELRGQERSAFGERHGKTDFYEYLKDVYSRREWAKRSAMKVAALYEIGVRKNKTPMRIIIDASSEEDRQTKSKWLITLQYAEAKKVRESDFVDFLRENGGPAGCATKMAALKKKRAKKKKARW